MNKAIRTGLNIWRAHALHNIGVRERGRGARAPSPKNSGKYFSGNYYVKFAHFSGKYHKN